jgi:hypothetical protein
MRNFLAALLLSMPLCGAAHAAEPTRTDVKITDAVPGHAGVTYAALLQQVIPDLKRADGGTSAFWTSEGISIRDVEGGMSDTAGMSDTGAISLSNLQTLTLRHEGKDLLVVMAPDYAASGWLAITAVYDMAPATPKLIDAVNAGMDQTTGLGTTLALSDSEGGITVTGAHGNSNEYFETVQVLMLQETKLVSVMSSGTYSLLVCGMQMKQTGELVPEPDEGKPYAALVYTITQDVTHVDEECEPGGVERLPEGVMSARDVFHWDAAAGKFVATTKNRDQLMGPD